MNDGNDNGDFHLHTVDELQVVFGSTPDGVDAEGVDALWIAWKHLFLHQNVTLLIWQCRRIITRSKEVHIHPHKVIIYPTTVKPKESHH